MEYYGYLILKNARKSRGLTQEMLSSLIPVSKSTLINWETAPGYRTVSENGITRQVKVGSRPSPEDVDRIAEILEYPGLWENWMDAAFPSYRRHHPRRDGGNDDTLTSIVRLKHEIKSFATLHETLEQDALDGTIDDEELKRIFLEKADAVSNAIATASKRVSGNRCQDDVNNTDRGES